MKESPDRETLAPEFLTMAYCSGYFPMADSKTGAIGWYSPDPRAIIPLEGFVTPRSLRQRVRQRRFRIRVDIAFEQVVEACAEREDTWISREIIEAYTGLHRLGIAHSVEAWQNDMLMGGLYGVAIGGAFFGESMFTRVTDASKVALVWLVNHLRKRGFRLLDTQIMNDHVRRFGAIEIPREKYLAMLAEAIVAETNFTGEVLNS